MSGQKGGPEKLIVKGKRLDGRALDELREIEIEAGIIPNAQGSCRMRLGKTEVLVAVYGPRELFPKHMQMSDKAYLSCHYDMISFATKERARPGPNRRSKEISMVMTSALAPSIMLEKYPKATIDVYAMVSNASAGTRCAAISAAAVALADAGIEMKEIVSSIAVGKIDGKLALDMNDVEDNFGEADFPLAIMNRTKEITLLQQDGNFTPQELKEALKTAMGACAQINKLQREALKHKYKGDTEDGDY